MTSGLSDGRDLGPCSSMQGLKFSQLDEENVEAKRKTSRTAEQPKQRQVLGLDLCHHGKDFNYSEKLPDL